MAPCPWVAVVEAATEWQAHEQLLNHPCPGPGRDLTVLPAGLGLQGHQPPDPLPDGGHPQGALVPHRA